MNNKLHFSTGNDEWATDRKFFKELNERYDFTLDPCCEIITAVCDKYYTPLENGLIQSWAGERVYVNPPYSRWEQDDWINKSLYEAQNGAELVVMLIPARTDKIIFHEVIQPCGKIEFIKGRLTFGTEEYWEWLWEQEFHKGKRNSLYKKYGKKNHAPFASMLVEFKF